MVLIRRRSADALLVQHDTVSEHRFERLLGGHIEFGERAADAAQRELFRGAGP